MSKRKRPTPKRVERWGPWFLDPRSPTPDGTMIYGNGYWTVHVRYLTEDRTLAGAVHLSLHDKPRSTRHDWRDMQRIKDELCGPEREAVELYPATSRLLDTSNEYHLWVLPEGERFNFGFDYGRPITEAEVADLSPEDVAATRVGLGLDADGPDRARQRERVR